MTYARTVWLVRYSLSTIVLMLALGTLTRYSGTDTTLGLAFADILLRQRVAVNMQNRSTRTSIVGVDVAMPVALAPTGLTAMQHADGEILAARAAEKFGVPFTLSTMSTCSIEEVAAHIKSRFWFQVYVMKDRDFIEPLIDRAKSANCGALMMTLDLQMLGQRHKDIRRPVGAAHASRRSGRDVRRIR